MDRRSFLNLTLAGMASTVVSACASTTLSPVAAVTPTLADVSPTPRPTIATTALGRAAPGTILRNENLPGFYVRYFKPFPAPDPATWQLFIGGLVETPMTLSLDQILQLPRQEQDTRMKCVECWSSRARWAGFTYSVLAALVRPMPGATHLHFTCADGYWEVLPIAELEKPGALFVTHMNGDLLPAKYGAPLRMIVPWLYGYKGAKAIVGLDFRAEGGPGYWSTVGPYSVDGQILPGTDHPLDLDRRPRQMSGGEITAY
jgi:sulfoxide reductase catalytic subunit YedY